LTPTETVGQQLEIIMAIPKGHKQNFNTLIEAFQNNDVALMECQLSATSETVAVICAANKMPNGEIQFVPFAMLFNGNPYCQSKGRDVVDKFGNVGSGRNQTNLFRKVVLLYLRHLCRSKNRSIPDTWNPSNSQSDVT